MLVVRAGRGRFGPEGIRFTAELRGDGVSVRNERFLPSCGGVLGMGIADWGGRAKEEAYGEDVGGGDVWKLWCCCGFEDAIGGGVDIGRERTSKVAVPNPPTTDDDNDDDDEGDEGVDNGEAGDTVLDLVPFVVTVHS